MKRISLRQFRDTLPDLMEVVEVQRRDPQGNHQVLGYWTPYMMDVPGSEVLPPERTGMVFAAAKRENKADVGPVTAKDIKTALTTLGKTPYQANVQFRPVPKPARKK